VKLIFEKSVEGRRGYDLPPSDVPRQAEIPENLCRSAPAELPQLSELDVMRHFTALSRKNFGVDSGFYPLGSCTMKYNPKLAESLARLPGLSELHPMLAQLPGGDDLAGGSLEILAHLDELLREICGMAAFTTQPMAGANGELTGVLIMAAYHKARGHANKNVILIPDSAHGTNPASAALAGFEVRTIASGPDGEMDIAAVEAAIDENVAGMMLTAPNTLGLFNPRVHQIADKLHAVDALMYYDGANLNALLGRARPGDLGFDIVHLNLHKTFATPHGGGGPGAGPVGVVEKLVEYLPCPRVERDADGKAVLKSDCPDSIGPVAPFYGNFGICLRAYAYILRLGAQGLLKVSENAVINANYIMARLKGHYQLPYPGPCMHECVLSASGQAEAGVRALDIAKGLIDRGFHPPTVYFPLIVAEAMMIEPTETEGKETLDAFCDAMIDLAAMARENPDALHQAPVTTPVGRLDETRAARQPDLASL
jgi:glycine dehydrogenase subunit 2